MSRTKKYVGKRTSRKRSENNFSNIPEYLASCVIVVNGNKRPAMIKASGKMPHPLKIIGELLP